MKKPCKIPGCDGWAERKGMCQAHAARLRDGRDLYAPLVRRRPYGLKCSIPGCERKGDKAGLCGAHAYRLKRHGDVQAWKPVKDIAPRGRGWINDSGYRCFTIKGVTHLEHRLVMEQAIGRKLNRGETVHHINGDRLDNRLENLQLRKGTHGSGQSVRCADCGSTHIEYVGLGSQPTLV